MKRFLFVICCTFFVTGLAVAQVGPGRTMYVVVKTVPLKASANSRGNTVATLNYGDQVTVIKADGKFVEVRSTEDESLTGWAAAENFTTKRIVAGNTTSVSASEVAMAGKGFNQDVENSYKAQGELNYAEVDRVETIAVDEAEMERFIDEGHLSRGR